MKNIGFKEIDFDYNESPFLKFVTSRYSISSKIDVSYAWDFAKENGYSFFITSLGCLMSGLNQVPELKWRYINNETIEFDHLEGITPIMDENSDSYLEMRVQAPCDFDSFEDWHFYVKNRSSNILNGSLKPFDIPMDKRDSEPTANFSCVPWIDFDTLNPCILEPHQIQPLVTWGKVNKDKKMSVAITTSHIFINGEQLGYFYEAIQKYFYNPLSIIK